MILYNSMDPACRCPVGAVEEQTEVVITVRVARRAAAAVQLILVKDNEPEQAVLMEWVDFYKGYDSYRAAVRPAWGLYWYYFRLGGRENVKKDRGGALWQLTVYQKDYRTPDWIKGGLIYHIFVDRFFRAGSTPVRPDVVFREDWGGVPLYEPDEQGIVKNTDFFGGNLQGIIQKLNYIKSMGVSAIYLSPVFEANSNHKYDTGDYHCIDPMFGSEEDFTELVQQAADRGMRVICDGVFNHTGDDSVYFNKYGRYDSVGAYQSQQSPYYDWYTFRHWNEDYECWWGVKILPSVRHDSDGFLKFITGDTGVIASWMKKGASSWRLDVADELSDRMLDGIRRAAKQENPDSLIIGEVWEDASNKVSYGARRRYLLGAQLDAVTNYPLRDAIIQFVVCGSAEVLKSVLQTQQENYPPQALHCMMNILSTHDTMRILTVLGTDKRPETKAEMAGASLSAPEYAQGVRRLMAASFLQMFLPGVPCIYYGDEAGAEGYTDPFNRRCYPWGRENKELIRWYRKIAAIRRGEAVFQTGAYKALCAKDGVFIFERSQGKAKIVAGVNLTTKSLPLRGNKHDLLSGEVQDRLQAGQMILYKE